MKNVASGKATCADVYKTHEEGYTGDYMKGLIKSVSVGTHKSYRSLARDHQPLRLA